MKLPSRLDDLSECYVIDRIKDGNIYYLWTIEFGEWVIVRTGEIKTLMEELEELCQPTTTS
jgi:hypothetical protein